MWLFTRLDPARPRSIVGWALVVGVAAGLLTASYHTLATEPLIDDAIAIEEARTAAEADEAGVGHPAAEPEQVSRSDQRGAGLFGGMALYGAAYALLLSVSALAMRGAWLDPFRRTVLAGSILAASITVVPWLKYPPVPPAVGDTATAGERQRYYWLLVAIAGLALAGAAHLSARLRERGWPEPRRVAATVVGAIAVLGVVLVVMPAVNDPIASEVPANLIWRFRLSSLAGNLVLWSTLTLTIGLWWSERARPPGTAAPSPATTQNSMPFNAETPAS